MNCWIENATLHTLHSNREMGPVTAMAIDVGGDEVLGLADGLRVGALNARYRTAPNSHALHEASLRIVVVDRVVLGRSIIPHCNRVRRPVKPVMVFGDQRLMEQRVEQ